MDKGYKWFNTKKPDEIEKIQDIADKALEPNRLPIQGVKDYDGFQEYIEKLFPTTNDDELSKDIEEFFTKNKIKDIEKFIKENPEKIITIKDKIKIKKDKILKQLKEDEKSLKKYAHNNFQAHNLLGQMNIFMRDIIGYLQEESKEDREDIIALEKNIENEIKDLHRIKINKAISPDETVGQIAKRYWRMYKNYYILEKILNVEPKIEKGLPLTLN